MNAAGRSANSQCKLLRSSCSASPLSLCYLKLALRALGHQSHCVGAVLCFWECYGTLRQQ